MPGLKETEKDVKASDGIFEELDKLPPNTVNDALDEECIQLAIRLIGARECRSPKAGKIAGQLKAKTTERDGPARRASIQRQELLQKNSAINRPHIGHLYERTSRHAQIVAKLFQTQSAGEERNYMTDQKTQEILTNENTVQEILDRITSTRSAVMGMEYRPLREILQKIDQYNEWYRSLDLDEIKPNEIVEIAGPVPKWAK